MASGRDGVSATYEPRPPKTTGLPGYAKENNLNSDNKYTHAGQRHLARRQVYRNNKRLRRYGLWRRAARGAAVPCHADGARSRFARLLCIVVACRTTASRCLMLSRRAVWGTVSCCLALSRAVSRYITLSRAILRCLALSYTVSRYLARLAMVLSP